jgi:hypothetical protein
MDELVWRKGAGSKLGAMVSNATTRGSSREVNRDGW